MAAIVCDCCAHPSAQKYNGYRACNMCKPEAEERIADENINDNGRVRRATVRIVTYRCTSPICDNQITFVTHRFVQKFLED